MQINAERFTTRFDSLFKTEGLVNIKFFVMDKSDVTLDDFFEEAAEIQSTIAAGEFEVIKSIDSALERKAFNAAF